MGQYLACFKAYDVRGKVPSELNPDIAYAIGRAYADQTGAKKVCIGYDIRLSGPSLYDALARGLNDAGVALGQLLPHLPLQVEQIRAEPDGTFPNGVPNPILEEARAMTVNAMRTSTPQPPPPFSGHASGNDDSGAGKMEEGGRFDFG